jgi:hypothetical protein
MFFPLFFRVVLLEAILNSFGLDELNLHSHDISVISFVVLFISFGKVMVTMGSQVEGSQTIQLGDQLLSLELVKSSLGLILFSAEEELQGSKVVVYSGAGVMAHVEAFADPFDCEDPDVDGEVSVDILGYFF